ncbi:MAG TPA: L,D-transpeptidase family protein [Nitrospiraceae bacterium]|nr:L,D-transpeptidase family protein [Nitrospiraceae bacterium]
MACGRIHHAIVTGGICALLLSGCVQVVPPELITAIDAIDHDLIALRAPEAAPEEYAHFVRQWVSLKSRVQSDDDLIRWPWESSDVEDQLRRLQDEGGSTVARLNERQAAQRRTAESKLERLEERFQLIASQVESIEGRIVLGEKPVQADLLMKQARSFFEQKDYERSIQASDKADHVLLAQTTVLTQELGRYADEKRIAHWQAMAKQTIEWSRTHQSTAIVVSKAERVLTLYKNGRKVLSYPVRLGFNGIREKQFQGDGATPEGRYRVTAKRGQGQTQFYRALALDYPNAEDRRRFQLAKKSGRIAAVKAIGGQIEIHGVENELMAQTLGCIMLDNPYMVALYEHVTSGTPVTIVGALTGQNSVALALAQLSDRKEET